MKKTTNKRIAAAVIIDFIDMMRDKDLMEYGTVGMENYKEVRQHIENIIDPIEKRLDNITGEQPYDHIFEGRK